MRGVGEGAVIAIVEGREGTPYSSLFDFSTRVNLKDCNKRVFEALALGGGFDSFGFTVPSSSRRTTRTAHSWNWRSNSSRNPESANSAKRPFSEAKTGPWTFPSRRSECEPWASMDLLNKEREIVGVYHFWPPLGQVQA